MKLYLIRHGDAVPSAVDQQRSLSTLGQIQVQSLAERLIEQDVKPIYLYHSGILRAEQTAQILAKNLNVMTVKKIPGLLPEDTIELIFTQIATWTQDTMLVGHLPYMAYLLEALSNIYTIQFDTATAVCLLRKRDSWEIEAVFHP